MQMTDIILKKRNGEQLSTDEINFFIRDYSLGYIPDYQVSALMMAIYFQGMGMPEIIALTQAMVDSGECLDLSKIEGTKVDKHSTGGVGDKTSLVLGPLVAAAGVKVPKLSGRGLGHTGGTIDKLESIEGFSAEISQEQFLHQVQTIGIALAGQSRELVPADKKIYALRDVTATVDCFPLIASSIMSKKIASGADAIVLDVKMGSGSFCKDIEYAIELAEILVHIGEEMGRETIALITEMDQPLGNAIGNALEVKEAIDTLNGRGPEDFQSLCISLASYMLILSGKAKHLLTARQDLLALLMSGAAKSRFDQMIHAQGGDLSRGLPQASQQIPIHSPRSGYIHRIQADLVGKSAMLLGAGRKKKEDTIDAAAGVYLHAKVGEKLQKGQLLATLHSNRPEQTLMATQKLLEAYQFGDEKAPKRPLIWAKVSKKGTERFSSL